MRPLSIVGLVSLIVAALGAIVWGMIAIWDYNLVTELFSGNAVDVVYTIVGIAGVIALLSFLGIVDWSSRMGAGGRLLGVVAAIATALTIIGALNWGLVGLFDYNLVTELFDGDAVDVIYTIVGISGLLTLVLVPFTLAAGESARRRVVESEVDDYRRAA